MVGLPGSGKSTEISRLPKGLPIASTDWHIQYKANLIGKSYEEVFDEYVLWAHDEMYKDIAGYIQANSSFVWDQTNLSKWKRSKVLDIIPDHYKKVAIVMHTPFEKCLEFNDKRERRIDPKVIYKMRRKLQPVDETEGFDQIIYVNL